MASMINLFLASLVLFCILEGARAGICGPTDLAISQLDTGVITNGQPEHEVIVANNCHCPQSNVTVKCYRLMSAEPVDSKAIKPVDGENCIVNLGRPIAEGSPVQFKYAWNPPQNFSYVSSDINCS